MGVLKLKAATVTSRTVAFLADMVIAGLLIGVGMYGTLGTIDPVDFLLATGYTELLIVLFIPAIFFCICLANGNATPGMVVADIEALTAKEHAALSWLHAALRTILWPLSVAPAGLGLATYYVTERRQTLHDLLSGTRVVERPFMGIKVSYEPWAVLWPLTIRLGPIILTLILATLVYLSDAGTAREMLGEALTAAVLITMGVVIAVTAFRIQLSKVRMTPAGIQRSGLLGWRKRIVAWEDIDKATFKQKRFFSYLKCQLNNRRSLRIPIHSENASSTGIALKEQGVFIE